VRLHDPNRDGQAQDNPQEGAHNGLALALRDAHAPVVH
jgi:hypothetical protein